MFDQSPAQLVDLESVVRHIAGRSGLRATVADIERVMAALLTSSDFWEVVGLSGCPANLVAAIIAGLAGDDLARVTEKVALTTAGTAAVWGRGLVPRKRFRCSVCAGRGLALDVFRRTQSHWEQTRAAPPAPPEGSLSFDALAGLAAFLADRGDLLGKAVLMLGDPSGLGVVLALSGFPRQVTVLTSNKEDVQMLDQTARERRINLAARYLASDDPLPSDLRGVFTTLVLGRDAPAEALVQEMLRGLPALNGPGCGVVHSLSAARSSLTVWAELQEQLLATGYLVLTDILRDALEHDHAPSLEGLPSGFTPEVRPPLGRWYQPAIVRWETLYVLDSEESLVHS